MFFLKCILVLISMYLRKGVFTMYDILLQKKNEYASLVENLQYVYNNLLTYYNKLLSMQKTLTNSFTINDNIYNKKELDNIINSTIDNINKIKDKLLPKAKEEYQNILMEISSL